MCRVDPLLRAGTEPGPAERGSFLPWQRPRGVAYMTRAPQAKQTPGTRRPRSPRRRMRMRNHLQSHRLGFASLMYADVRVRCRQVACNHASALPVRPLLCGAQLLASRWYTSSPRRCRALVLLILDHPLKKVIQQGAEAHLNLNAPRIATAVPLPLPEATAG